MEVGSINSHMIAPVDKIDSTQSEALAQNRDLVKAVQALNGAELFGQNYELTFVMDRDSHRPVLRLVDRDTREVIRQIPPDYVLRMAGDLAAKP